MTMVYPLSLLKDGRLWNKNSRRRLPIRLNTPSRLRSQIITIFHDTGHYIHQRPLPCNSYSLMHRPVLRYWSSLAVNRFAINMISS